MQKIYPSIHALEIFMPVASNENFFTNEIVRKLVDIPFYKGLEMQVLSSETNRRIVRDLVEKHKLQLTCWLSPTLIEEGLNLSSLDETIRKKSIARAICLTKQAAEMGVTHCGLPCGPFQGEEKLEGCKDALFDSYSILLQALNDIPYVDYTFEPLDRYADKKMLLGPIGEVADFFKKLRMVSDRIFIHWDSAHETLANADLMQSLEIAKPYLAQIHLCNCVNDKSHPYYGDLHMDVGQAPDFKNWGYLTAEIGAQVIRKVASFDINEGVHRTFCAIEVRSKTGNDLWAKEQLVRTYLQKVFDLAEMEYEK